MLITEQFLKEIVAILQMKKSQADLRINALNDSQKSIYRAVVQSDFNLEPTLASVKACLRHEGYTPYQMFVNKP